MNYSSKETKIGWLYIEENNGCITKIQFKKVEGGLLTPLLERTFKEIEEYISGNRKEFSIPLYLEGSAFQKKVWSVLKKIPYGETRSYKQIAEAVGNPKACRAVGLANNKNPIAIIIPCHRVIGSGGKLTGYAGGLDLKAKLLSIEQS